MSEHVGGVYKMKNNNKNYIKEFMKENNIKANMPFEIESKEGDYTVYENCFMGENFSLYIIKGRDDIKQDNTALLLLLMGEYRIANKIKAVAKILGVEMNEPFKVKEDEWLDIATVGEYILTNNGLIDSKGNPAPECLTRLLTGKRVIIEED